jgi:hypothetical protein
MSYNMMIGYDIYDRFTVEHFPLRQSMILTTSFFFARYSIVQWPAKKVSHYLNVSVSRVMLRVKCP